MKTYTMSKEEAYWYAGRSEAFYRELEAYERGEEPAVAEDTSTPAKTEGVTNLSPIGDIPIKEVKRMDKPEFSYPNSPAEPEPRPEPRPEKTPLDKFYGPSEEAEPRGGYGEIGITGVRLPAYQQYSSAIRFDTMGVRDIPHFLAGTFKSAHQAGILPGVMSHYIGTLAGLELIDSTSLGALKDLRKKITGNYRNDEKVLPEILSVISSLRATRR